MRVSPGERGSDLHGAQAEDGEEGHLDPRGHLQAEEDPEGQRQCQDIGQDGQRGGAHVEGRRVDAGPPRRGVAAGLLPEVADGPALEDDGNEDGDHEGQVEGVEPDDGVPDPPLLAAQAEQEHQDRALHESQNRVVEELDDVVPEAAQPLISHDGDVFDVDADEGVPHGEVRCHGLGERLYL